MPPVRRSGGCRPARKQDGTEGTLGTDADRCQGLDDVPPGTLHAQGQAGRSGKNGGSHPAIRIEPLDSSVARSAINADMHQPVLEQSAANHSAAVLSMRERTVGTAIGRRCRTPNSGRQSFRSAMAGGIRCAIHKRS